MATISSVTTPQKTVGSKVSRVVSAFNPVVFVFNFTGGTHQDKLQFKLVFGDASESTIYTYTLVNTSQMRRDLSGILKQYLKHSVPLATIGDAFDEGTNDMVLKFKVAYRLAGVESFTETSFFFATWSVFQLGHSDNGNLFEYLAVFDVEGSMVGNAGKFLTKFERPKYFEGYPFYLSYLTPIELNQMTITDTFAYVNGVQNSVTSPDGTNVLHAVINIAGTTNENNVYISQGGSLGEDVFDNTFDDTFWGTPDDPAFELIQRLYFDKVCTSNYKDPICLVWLNSLGGWSMWVFDEPQFANKTSGENYTEFATDTLLANEFGTLLERTKETTIRLSVDKVTSNEYDALQEIVDSPFVYWRVSDTYFMQVKTRTNTYQKNPRGYLYDFSVEIETFKVYGQY